MNGLTLGMQGSPRRRSSLSTSSSSSKPRRRSSSSSTSTSTTPKGTPDRFIPNRDTLNYDAASYKLTNDSNEEIEDNITPAKLYSMRKIKENLFAGSPSNILSFRNNNQRQPRQGFLNERNALQEVVDRSTSLPTSSDFEHLRSVPQTPDRILDAPDLRCDFYLNVLDWSSQNIIAIALGETVYLWNANDGSIHELLTTTTPNDYVSSLAWSADGEHLSVGTAMNQIQLWNVSTRQRMRTMQNEFGRISAASWNETTLSAGSRNGVILNHDVRAREHVTSALRNGHHQEICGLKWSPDGKYLCSGGNDNLVNIWDAAGSNVHKWSNHQAAVKAIAWCPWHSSVIATGGGTDDRTVKMWNVNVNSRNNLMHSTDTCSQISSLLWNKEYRELISGHGFSDNHLSIWKYGSTALQKVTELKGHTERVLAMAQSPDGSTVVSAGGDETLRFWKCFSGSPKPRRSSKQIPSKLMAGIR